MRKKRISKKEKLILKNQEKTRIYISRTILAIAILIGLIFTIMGALSMQQDFKVRNEYNKTIGIYFASKQDEKGYYIPTYGYLINSEQYFYQSTEAFEEVPTGENVIIYYDAENPETAVVEHFDANKLLFVIGVMMLSFPLVLYLLDDDMQKYDKSILMASVVMILGILFYFVSGSLIGSYNIVTMCNYGGILVIMPIVYVLISILALINIYRFKDEKENKKVLGIF
jgi:hypothetical protein